MFLQRIFAERITNTPVNKLPAKPSSENVEYKGELATRNSNLRGGMTNVHAKLQSLSCRLAA